MMKRYVQAPNVVKKQIDDDVFLIEPDAGTIHHLNPVGAGIWQLFSEPRGVSEILTVLREAFPDTKKKKVAKDLNDLIDEFLDNELIEEAKTNL